MGHSADRKRPRGAELNWARDLQPIRLCSSVRIQRNERKNMNQPQVESQVGELPLPDTQRELELLLEALHALNNALDQYETAELVKA